MKHCLTYEGLDCAGIEVERDCAERLRDEVEVAARRPPPQSNPGRSGHRIFVLVLSGAVLVLVLEWGDHDRADLRSREARCVPAVDRVGGRVVRIVSMLTRLIQRTDRVVDAAIEYEYEYRDAE